MVFELVRYGVRNGIGQDYFNTSWKSGELNSLGKRQHYLLGRDLRDHYYQSLIHSSEDIFVRTAGSNRSIESAMAQMVGMFPHSA